MRSSWVLLILAGLAAWACSDSFAPPGTAGAPDSVVALAEGMRLVTIRWSAVPGAVGYRIERRADLHGSFVALREIASGFVTSTSDQVVEPGTFYGYRVRTIAASGATSAPSLVAGARTAPWPGIRVATNTSPPELADPDGYQVLVVGPASDTMRAPLGVADERIFSPLPVGTYQVHLTGVAVNCRATPDTTAVVPVTDQGLQTQRDVSVLITCVDPNVGRLSVSVATSGDSLDADGYTLTLSGVADDASLPDSLRAYYRRDIIGVQFSHIYEALHPGDYSLSLEGLAGNCALAGQAVRDFRVERLANLSRAFTVTCQAPEDPTRPLVWRSRWSTATASAGQHVALDVGLDLSRRPGQDVAAVQSSLGYDAAVVRLDSAVKQGPWQATFNTSTPGVANWLAFVNGTGPVDSTVFARFYFTVIGSAGATTTTASTVDVADDGASHDLRPLIRRAEGTFTVAAGAANQAPVARPGGPYAGTAGQPVAFDGTASTDPDGTLSSYAWAFGDGATATGAVASHSYATPGTYTTTLTVVDNLGATATGTAPVAVSGGGGGGGGNQAPTAVVNGPYSGAAGAPVSFSAAGSSDPDGSIATYAWTFGDGASANGSAPTHTYAAAGTYTVTLTVTDNGGAAASAVTTAAINGGAAKPFTWLNAFGPINPADSLVTLTISLDLTTDIPQTPGVEALQSWVVDSLKWDATALRYFAFNFGSGGGSVNPTDAARGKLTFSGVVSPTLSTGVVTIATVKFKVIGTSGRAATTTTSLGLLLGTPATGSFSYGGFTAVQEAVVTVP